MELWLAEWSTIIKQSFKAKLALHHDSLAMSFACLSSIHHKNLKQKKELTKLVQNHYLRG